ncbi:MAG: hypothetical protein OS112_05525 [Methanoregula sp.]|nr:MAG: hypothetical protein OS112_05525 [Methanoregula sp.]
MKPLTTGTMKTKIPGDSPFTQVLRDELSAVQKNRADLMAPQGHLGIHLFTLLVCVLVNVIFFLVRTDYFGLFIAASFYLNMYYFITLIIPTNFRKTTLPAADLSRFHAWLKEIGIKSGTSQFTRLFINSLFINSRALSLGIGLIFSIDIAFTLIHYFQGLPLRTTLIVITQCAIIVIFYLLVWKMEPFSVTYVKKVESVRSSLHRQKLPPRLVTAMFMFGFLIAIFLFLTTMIFLPGVTLNAFLNQSQLSELGHLFSLLAVLAISQYFIIRYIHGITSRAMAERLFDFKENSLKELFQVENASRSGSLEPDDNPVDTSTLLLESKIFIVKRNSLGGAFPVFIVDLDFSVMMDSTTLTAIRGYIVEGKHEPDGKPNE